MTSRTPCSELREKGLKGNQVQLRHPSNQRVPPLECKHGEEVRPRLSASPHPATERTAAHPAHIHRRASNAPCELEAETAL